MKEETRAELTTAHPERTRSREGGACKISAGAAQNDHPNPSRTYKQNQTRDRPHRGELLKKVEVGTAFYIHRANFQRLYPIPPPPTEQDSRKEPKRGKAAFP